MGRKSRSADWVRRLNAATLFTTFLIACCVYAAIFTAVAGEPDLSRWLVRGCLALLTVAIVFAVAEETVRDLDRTWHPPEPPTTTRGRYLTAQESAYVRKKAEEANAVPPVVGWQDRLITPPGKLIRPRGMS